MTSTTKHGITNESHESILLRQIELIRADPLRNAGSRRVSDYQIQLIELYLAQNRLAKAHAMYDSLSAKDRKRDIAMDDIILAVRTGRLQALLDKWRANLDAVPRGRLRSGSIQSLEGHTGIQARPSCHPSSAGVHLRVQETEQSAHTNRLS